MRTGTIRSLALLAILAGCASSKPHTFGAYDAMAPKVTPAPNERAPRHLTVELSRPANVAIFLVVPGAASRLLWPADSTSSGHMDAGSHKVETALNRGALSDTSALIRRPAQPGQRQPSSGGRGRMTSRDSLGVFGNSMRGYILLYASQDSLPYSVLASRVQGITVPIEDDDALNTVTKLIRSTTRTTGQWAAYATDFPP